MAEETLKERLTRIETERQNKTEKALLEIEGGTTTAPVVKKKKKKPAERVGTGQSSFDLDAAIAGIEAQIKRTNDPNMKAKLAARIEALKANAE